MLRRAVALSLMLAAQSPRGGPRGDAGTADALRLRACELREQARYRDAESQLRLALSLAEAKAGGSRQACQTENDLGILYEYMGRFDDAEQAYRHALALSKDDATLADLYRNLGVLEHARRRDADGEAWARRGLAIRQKLLGPNHAEVAADLAALAPLLDGQGKRAEAASMTLRALDIQQRAYGPDSCELAVNLNNLAALRYAEGKRSEALALYDRALGIKVRCLGPEHPGVATTLNNMAVARKAEGDREEASRLYGRALAIFEKSLGPEHPSTLACRANYERLERRETAVLGNGMARGHNAAGRSRRPRRSDGAPVKFGEGLFLVL